MFQHSHAVLPNFPKLESWKSPAATCLETPPRQSKTSLPSVFIHSLSSLSSCFSCFFLSFCTLAFLQQALHGGAQVAGHGGGQGGGHGGGQGGGHGGGQGGGGK